MNAVNAKLGHLSVAFAIAASITVLFSTALAWAKDAYKPLNDFMNALVWHNWITHGLADVILFIGLGLTFSKTDWVERIAPNRLIAFLVAAVVVAGVGLFVWYAVF
ncbi:MAG TPA: hypothetical protein VJW93_01020 [Candidatus Acidoferrales bacterium]|nr:hypothetical protein [Candidatus Acidoferrales bacterium]